LVRKGGDAIEQYTGLALLLSESKIAFSALMLLVVWQEGHPACKN